MPKRDPDGIVHARFKGDHALYHYVVPGADIGDKIRSPGMYSDHAVVLGHGRSGGYAGPVRDAVVVGRAGSQRDYLYGAPRRSASAPSPITHAPRCSNNAASTIHKETRPA
jgi:hypothetical protein